jgi:hypothetical protein
MSAERAGFRGAMPKKITVRPQGRWVNVAPNTDAMDLCTGMLVRVCEVSDVALSGYPSAVSLCFVPGASLDAEFPPRELEVCADGDPECGDPECERTHAPAKAGA